MLVGWTTVDSIVPTEFRQLQLSSAYNRTYSLAVVSTLTACLDALNADLHLYGTEHRQI